MVTIRPELRIIDDETFDRAQEILKGRHDSFKLTHERQSNKYLFSTLMYTDDLIFREELNEKIGGMRKEIERLESELKMVSYHLTKGEQLEAILNSTFKQMEDITDVHEMTNTQLKRLIQKIEVDKDGNVDIYLRLIGELGLDETVLVEGTEETVPNRHNHT